MTKKTPRPARSAIPKPCAPATPAPSIASGSSASRAAPSSAPVAKLTKCGKRRALCASGIQRNDDRESCARDAAEGGTDDDPEEQRHGVRFLFLREICADASTRLLRAPRRRGLTRARSAPPMRPQRPSRRYEKKRAGSAIRAPVPAEHLPHPERSQALARELQEDHIASDRVRWALKAAAAAASCARNAARTSAPTSKCVRPIAGPSQARSVAVAVAECADAWPPARRRPARASRRAPPRRPRHPARPGAPAGSRPPG